MTIRLYDYWRSSASYRVRIALNMKGLAYEAVPTSLLDGAQRSPDYVAKNPQGFVPMLEVGGLRLTQSLAIIDWLDATQPGVRLIPSDPDKRAHALAMAYLIASDIHPLNNLRILKYLKNELGVEEAARDDWYRHWIIEGFAALEAMRSGSTHRWMHFRTLCGSMRGATCWTPSGPRAQMLSNPEQRRKRCRSKADAIAGLSGTSPKGQCL